MHKPVRDSCLIFCIFYNPDAKNHIIMLKSCFTLRYDNYFRLFINHNDAGVTRSKPRSCRHILSFVLFDPDIIIIYEIIPLIKIPLFFAQDKTAAGIRQAKDALVQRFSNSWTIIRRMDSYSARRRKASMGAHRQLMTTKQNQIQTSIWSS